MVSQGDKFPEGVQFKYIPVELKKTEDPLACSIPTVLNVDKLLEEDKNGFTLIVSVPGAFTPTCTANHIPPYLNNLSELVEKKNINTLIVISANDAFVLNAWGKLLVAGAKMGDGPFPKVFFASDPLAEFSLKNGLSVDASANGMGIRTARYALAIRNSDRQIVYLGKETEKGVKVSGLDAVLQARL